MIAFWDNNLSAFRLCIFVILTKFTFHTYCSISNDDKTDNTNNNIYDSTLIEYLLNTSLVFIEHLPSTSYFTKLFTDII